MAAADASLERFWDQLLIFIEDGKVIPVVGQDLLGITTDGRSQSLFAFVAPLLAQRLGLAPATLGESLNTVACRYKEAGGPVQDVYLALKSILAARKDLPVPESLAKLAAIAPLKLFVTTTFDDCLERSLNAVRFRGKPRTRVFAYSPESPTDLPPDPTGLEPAAVYHLFGRLSSGPDYAVTDEDTLEFVHSLHSETRRPNRLFDELNNRHLLLVGNSFPDWLSRFFLRLARRERLSTERTGSKDNFVADESVTADAGLLYFLQHFSARTRVFPGGGAVAFVDQLHARWLLRHPAGDVEEAGEVPAPSSLRPGSVFLSYANEDRAAAERLKDALQEEVDVWLDKDDLRGGEKWWPRIKRAIEDSSIFVPLLSESSLTRSRGVFWKEWNYAAEVDQEFSPLSGRFIFPVRIDESAMTGLPDYIRVSHVRRALGGQPARELVGEIAALVREYGRSTRHVQ